MRARGAAATDVLARAAAAAPSPSGQRMEESKDDEPSGWEVGDEEAAWLAKDEATSSDGEYRYQFDGARASDGESTFDHCDDDAAWLASQSQPHVVPPSATETEASAAEPHGDTMLGAQASHVQLPDILTVAPESAAPVPPIRSAPARSEPQAKKQRRNYAGVRLSLDQVEMLLERELEPRPLVLDVANTSQVEYGGWIFKETGKAIRRKGDPRGDKWKRGGGKRGATDLPNSLEPRVRRRYGYVVPVKRGSQRLRYHQYSRLLPTTKVDGS
eukprot:COSAG02_NODE_392_length_23227_cov_30.763620_26_plen_272_part_00